VLEIDYLGNKISASGMLPMQSKVRAIRDFPQPRQIQQLLTFLGMANFYRRFIPAVACVLRPLTDAVKGGKGKQLACGEEMVAAFKEMKSCLCRAVELAHQAAEAEIFLAVDAYSTHVGAALQQRVRGQTPRPLAFFSAKLEPPQQKYSAFN
jgi:hypothetical protein